MAVRICRASSFDRETCIGLLAAHLVEQDLPADPAGIARSVDFALAAHSSAWLLLAELDGAAAGIMLANQIVSVETYGSPLWVRRLQSPIHANPKASEWAATMSERSVISEREALWTS